MKFVISVIVFFVSIATSSIVGTTATAHVSTPPGLGDYSNTEVFLGADVSIVPSSAPVNAVTATGSASGGFQGLITVDPVTGIVLVTNAHTAGTFTITIRAFDNLNASAIKTFSLVVRSPGVCSMTGFKQAPEFPVGNNPQWVAVEDFDNDGKTDIATTSRDDQTVSVIRNTTTSGVSSFGPKVDFSVAGAASGIATGDLDGDGKIDIVNTNATSGNISILRNISTGTGNINFGTRLDLGAGSTPFAIAIADLTGDGKPEIIVSNSGANSLSIFRNTSPGGGTITFDTAVNSTVGSSPRGVSAADIDGDGKLDVVSANFSPDTVSVLRNTGSGGALGFAPKVDFSVGGFSGSNPDSNCHDRSRW